MQENDFVNFMRDPLSPSPSPPPATPQAKPEDDWADITGKEYIAFLTNDNFDTFVTKEGSVLVMFYAPCKCVSVCVRMHLMLEQQKERGKIRCCRYLRRNIIEEGEKN